MSDEDPTTESYFGAVAASYDRLQPVVAGPSYSRGLSVLIHLIPYSASDAFELVDLGSGTGELADRVLRRFPEARATCVDQEPGMLAIARRKLAAHGERARLLQADIETCDIPAADVILSCKVIHHVAPADLPPLLSRAAAALNPGGCLMLLDAASTGEKWTSELRRLTRRYRDRHVDAEVRAGRASRAEVEDRFRFKRAMKASGRDVEYSHAADDLLMAMAGAGLTDTAMAWRMFNDALLLGFSPLERGDGGKTPSEPARADGSNAATAETDAGPSSGEAVT